MNSNTTVSDKAMETILKLQQNEITEQAIYMNLSKRVKKQTDKELLESIGREEGMHSNIWKKYTNKDMKPKKLKVFFYSLLSIIFGYTFVIKLMENGEKVAESTYTMLSKEVPEASKIYLDEQKHEAALIGMLDEDRLQYVGSMVLGLNDALVELTGTLAGLTFALANSRLVGLAGLITGIAASLSMAASEYLSQKSEGSDTQPLKASMYTGIAYVITVAMLIFPFFFVHSPYIALIWSMSNALLIIAIFTFFVSIVRSTNFKPMFSEMVTVSFGVATISFIIGSLANKLLGMSS